MKPIINETTVKYIQCPECSFGKSFLLKDEIKRGTFAWFCPKCHQFLMGKADKDGILTEVKAGGQGGGKQQIVVSLPAGVSPVSVLFSYAANSQSDASGNQPPASDSGMLLLEAEAPDPETNSRGLPQFRTIIF